MNTIRHAVKNIFKEEETVQTRRGKVVAKSGNRYTLKDIHDRKFFAFSTTSFSLDDWVQVEGTSIVDKIAQPSERKVISL